jgi:hypothetical protein
MQIMRRRVQNTHGHGHGHVRQAAEALACLFGAACVAAAGTRFVSGVSAVAAASLLVRRGWPAANEALALFVFPDAFACLWALDVLRAVGPRATEAAARAIETAMRFRVTRREQTRARAQACATTPWTETARAAVGAVGSFGAVAAITRTEHLSRLPSRARRAGYWRAAWRSAAPSTSRSMHRSAARCLIAMAVACVLHPFFWQPSLLRRLAALWFAVDAALKSRLGSDKEKKKKAAET